MRNLKLLLFPAVVLVAIVGLGVTVGADPAARPFKGTVAGQVNFAPAPQCPVGLKTISDAEGTFAHLGRTTMHSEHCTPTGDFITGGAMTLVAANGDQLEIEYNAFAPFPPPTTVIHGTGDFEITGGTGRFAGATGGQLDSDFSTYNYTFDIVFPGFGEDGRPLPGPWPAVWTFGPTTISY